MLRLNSALALSLALSAASASAIVIRADVPDARYLALGDRYRDTVTTFPWVRETGEFWPSSGTGTLVAPQWVLTAAHVGVRFKPGHAENPDRSPDYVTINGRNYPVEQVWLAPGSEKGITRPGRDAALIKLAEPVEGGKPACLYPGRDEVGKVATVAGFGRTGTNLTGGEQPGGVLRAATTAFEESTQPPWIKDIPADETLGTRFRAPDHPNATPLEGSAAPGDSGGPAFLEHEGKLCIAGIAAAGVPPRKHTERAAAVSVAKVRTGPYQVSGIYARVSSLRDWAMDVMSGKVAP